MAWSISKVRQLFANDPVRLRKALGKPDIEAQARAVASVISSVVPLGADPSDPNTWARAAYALGVNHVFALDDDEEDTGIYDWYNREIFYNPNADEDAICRRIVHELAHDVQAHRKVGALRYGEERYDGDRKSVQHRVACRVEELLLGKRKP